MATHAQIAAAARKPYADRLKQVSDALERATLHQASDASYTVFVRNWWRWECTASGRRYLVPNPGARKTILARDVTATEALAICERYNAAHKPGPIPR